MGLVVVFVADTSFATSAAFLSAGVCPWNVLVGENNNQYDIDNLYIKEAYVGKSIVLKRFRPRAKGRASPIKKPYSNLTIILSENLNKKKELHGTKS